MINRRVLLALLTAVALGVLVGCGRPGPMPLDPGPTAVPTQPDATLSRGWPRFPRREPWALRLDGGADAAVPIPDGREDAGTPAPDAGSDGGLDGGPPRGWCSPDDLDGGYVAFDGGLAPRILACHQRGVCGIVSDGTYVYWTSLYGTALYSLGFVMKADIAGKAPPVILASGEEGPDNLVMDSQNLYWDTGGGSLRKLSLDGGQPVTLYPSLNEFTPLALDESYLYWLDYYGSKVMRVPIVGGPAETLAYAGFGPEGLTLSDGILYWSAITGPGSEMSLFALPLVAGATPRTVFEPQSMINQLVVSVNQVFWVMWSEPGIVSEQPLDGGPPEFLTLNEPGPFAVAADQDYFYWTDTDYIALRELSRSDGGVSTLLIGDSTDAFALAVDAKNSYTTDGTRIYVLPKR